MEGRDGQIHDGRGTLCNRPIQCLFPLELNRSEVLVSSNDKPDVEECDPIDTPVCSKRPRHSAAKKADECRKAAMFQLEDN